MGWRLAFRELLGNMLLISGHYVFMFIMIGSNGDVE